MFNMNSRCKVEGLGLLKGSIRIRVENGVFVRCCFANKRFRIVKKGILGLRLIMVYLYYEFELQGRRFKVDDREYQA